MHYKYVTIVGYEILINLYSPQALTGQPGQSNLDYLPTMPLANDDVITEYRSQANSFIAQLNTWTRTYILSPHINTPKIYLYEFRGLTP